MLFSWRKGYKSPRTVVQRESMDDALRNRLWNCLAQCYWNRASVAFLSSDPPMRALCRRIWHEFFKRPTDTLNDYWETTYNELRAWFFQAAWHEAYSFIEFVYGAYPTDLWRPDDPYQQPPGALFSVVCNDVLREELSAYRFVNGLITEVTAEEEIAAVEEALDATRRLPPVQEHLRKAQEHLADRKEPDYRNSIKESISAVESLLFQLTGQKGFAAALKALEVPLGLHGAEKAAFEKLYGYTSDAQGIRHGGTDESSLTFEDAKYMWVVCAAFVNFLTARAAAVGQSPARRDPRRAIASD